MTTMDDRTQPASLAAIQVAILNLQAQQDHYGGVLAGLDGLVRAHVAAEERRPKMSPAAIKAWLGGTAGILAILVGAVTQWRVAQAGAESRHQAEVAADQATARRNEVDRQKLVVQAAEEGAKRALAMHEREELEKRVRDEAAASMRVPRSR